MKVICKTTGSFMLVDYSNGGQTVKAGGAHVVTMTPFINSRAMIGQLQFMGEVTDEATDEELQAFIKDSDGDLDLAVSSFLGAYGLTAAEPTPKGKKTTNKSKTPVADE